MRKRTWKEDHASQTPDDAAERRSCDAFAGSQLASSSQNPNETVPVEGTATPALNDETRHQKQLEILNHFGAIDFDPDYDPLSLRQLDRDRMKRL